MKGLSGNFMNEDNNFFQRMSLMKYLETSVVFEKIISSKPEQSFIVETHYRSNIKKEFNFKLK